MYPIIQIIVRQRDTPPLYRPAKSQEVRYQQLSDSFNILNNLFDWTSISATPFFGSKNPDPAIRTELKPPLRITNRLSRPKNTGGGLNGIIPKYFLIKSIVFEKKDIYLPCKFGTKARISVRPTLMNRMM